MNFNLAKATGFFSKECNLHLMRMLSNRMIAISELKKQMNDQMKVNFTDHSIKLKLDEFFKFGLIKFKKNRKTGFVLYKLKKENIELFEEMNIMHINMY